MKIKDLLNKRILGTIPLFALILSVVGVGIGLGALLSYYGTITGAATVSQSITLNAMESDGTPIETSGYDDTDPISYCVAGDGSEGSCKTAVAGSSFMNGDYSEDGSSGPAISYFTLKNKANQAEDVTLTGSDINGITTEYTATITEKSGTDNYYNNYHRLVALNVEDTTLSELLDKDLEYTIDIVSDPKYHPNINIYLDGGKVIHAFGDAVSSSGETSMAFRDYVQNIDWTPVVRNGLSGSKTAGPYNSISALKDDLGSKTVTKVEVRAQAGSSAGQKLRLTNFKANGVTVTVPDSYSLTDLTLQPGETLNLHVSNDFAIDLKPDTYTITTKVVPVTG